MASDGALIFHIYISCSKTFSSVPRARSSVKVKYQGHVYKKMAVVGAFVFKKKSVFLKFLFVAESYILVCYIGQGSR